MENDTSGKFHKVSYDDQEPNRTFFGPVWHNEFKLTDEITEEIDINTCNNNFEITHKDKFPFYISSHDYCFFCIEPISDDMLTKVIHTILQQHNFYLGEEIQWEGIETQLAEIIKSNKEITIQSDPKRECLWIPQLEHDKGLFWKNRRKGTIILEGNKARFREFKGII